jgi:hypothetical protein
MPAEIRNQIYEEALLGGDMAKYAVLCFPGDNLLIDKTNHKEPALLHVCRQVRDEAQPYYRENLRMWIMIKRLKLAPQPEHWIWKVLEIEDVVDRSPCKWDFDNLMEWARLYHEGRMSVYPTDELEYAGTDPCVRLCYDFVATFFTVVEDLKAVSWDVAKKALEPWRKVFGSVIRETDDGRSDDEEIEDEEIEDEEAEDVQTDD